MTTYFLAVGSGIGDVVVSLSICRWIIQNSSEPVVMVARGPRQVGLSEVIPGLAGEIIEPDLQKTMMSGDRLINLRDHPLQKYYDWFSAEFQTGYPNFRITEILTRICRDFGLAVDVSEITPFEFTRDERVLDKVILIPGTTVRAKMVRAPMWINLYNDLQSMGIESVMIGELDRSKDTRDLVETGLPHIETPKIQDAINAISSARAVVSVDTGLMHVAVQQGVKTVAIHGACEVYHRPAPNCFPIFTNNFDRSKAFVAPPPGKPANFPPGGKEFAVLFNTWNWLPMSFADGDYIDFNDHQRVIDLLGLAERILI